MQEKNIYLRALQAEQTGDWAKAHEMVQDMVTAAAARVHSYLHSVERAEGKAECYVGRASFRDIV